MCLRYAGFICCFALVYSVSKKCQSGVLYIPVSAKEKLEYYQKKNIYLNQHVSVYLIEHYSPKILPEKE